MLFLYLVQVLPKNLRLESGEVGVFVSMEYTDVMSLLDKFLGIYRRRWECSRRSRLSSIASNFIYTSDEICLPEGEIPLIRMIQLRRLGFGSWYEFYLWSNTTIINNSGRHLLVLEVLNHFLCLL